MKNTENLIQALQKKFCSDLTNLIEEVAREIVRDSLQRLTSMSPTTGERQARRQNNNQKNQKTTRRQIPNRANFGQVASPSVRENTGNAVLRTAGPNRFFLDLPNGKTLTSTRKRELVLRATRKGFQITT